VAAGKYVGQAVKKILKAGPLLPGLAKLAVDTLLFRSESG
jgi:hypothetical protein